MPPIWSGPPVIEKSLELAKATTAGGWFNHYFSNPQGGIEIELGT